MTIKRHGKHIGKNKASLGVLSQKLTWSGKNILMKDEVLSPILSKAFTLLRISNSIGQMLSGS